MSDRELERLALGTAAIELLHPDQETHRIRHDHRRAPQARLRQAGYPAATRDRIGHPHPEQTNTVQARIASINPADLTRQTNQIQLRLTELSQGKTEALTTSRHLDMASLKPSIHRLQTTKMTESPRAHQP